MQHRGLTLFLVFVFVGTAVLLALGTWQWTRRADKLEFIARIAQAAARDPRPLAGARTWDRVLVNGRFQPEKTAYIRTSRPAPKPGERDSRGRVPVSGFGVMVMTAFETEPCVAAGCQTQTLLINRGFLPTPPSGEIPVISTPSGMVSIVGFLRPSERESSLPPGNDVGKGVFFYRTSPDVARFLGLSGDFEHFLDQQAPEREKSPPFGIDIADLIKAIPNNHLQYAITWWSLAATNLAVAAFFMMSRRRKSEPEAR
ncbi:COG3346 Uncharacterized conserved protein [Rhabdaerophilaceae bacterium]